MTEIGLLSDIWGVAESIKQLEDSKSSINLIGTLNNLLELMDSNLRLKTITL